MSAGRRCGRRPRGVSDPRMCPFLCLLQATAGQPLRGRAKYRNVEAGSPGREERRAPYSPRSTVSSIGALASVVTLSRGEDSFTVEIGQPSGRRLLGSGSVRWRRRRTRQEDTVADDRVDEERAVASTPARVRRVLPGTPPRGRSLSRARAAIVVPVTRGGRGRRVDAVHPLSGRRRLRPPAGRRPRAVWWRP